jgi:nitrate reductase gamma subunit
MHHIYQILSGPLLWITFGIFVFGSLYRIGSMILLVNRKEKFIFSFMSWKYGLRSICHWIVPFGSTNMRMNPVMTLVTFIFHLCLIMTPVFLLSHAVLWDEYWNIQLWTLPDTLSDFMTLAVIGCCIFFLCRRIRLPEVRYLTSASDYVILGIVVMPFLTGFIAYHQWIDYPFFMILHILSAEIMLIAIPFSRLSHMLFWSFTRAYMGSEFGGIRHARDW